MLDTIECFNCIQSIKNMQLSGIDFVRGLGIVENRLVLSFAADLDKIDIEVETNFRIRNDEKHFLSYNDLYLDTKRREMSVKRFRSQTNIEKSYLCSQLELINKELKGLKPRKVVLKEYGDIYIVFGNGIVVEIFNDTHLEDATLYRIVHRNGSFSECYECLIKDNELVYKSEKLL